MKDSKKKRDFVLIAALLAAACVFYVGSRKFFSAPAVLVEISVDGEVLKTLPLSEDTDLRVEGYRGGTNHLVIKDGEAWVTEASCPDKICLRQGKIPSEGRMIVCLPNRVIIKVTGGEE